MKQYALSVREAAALLSLSPWTIYALVQRGELACLRTVGKVRMRVVDGRQQPYMKSGRLRFALEDLVAWQREHRREAGAVNLPSPSVSAAAPIRTPARRRYA